MKRLGSHFLSTGILALLLSTAVNAEGGCPSGQYPQQGPGWRSCVPIPGAEEAEAAAPKGPRWIDAWGAFAADMDKGVLGISTNATSEQSAKSNALQDCQQQGGMTCKVTTYVRNGCMAMVVGSKLAITDQSATLAEAEAKTMSTCKSQDSDCRVYKSLCIGPKQIQ